MSSLMKIASTSWSRFVEIPLKTRSSFKHNSRTMGEIRLMCHHPTYVLHLMSLLAQPTEFFQNR